MSEMEKDVFQVTRWPSFRDTGALQNPRALGIYRVGAEGNTLRSPGNENLLHLHSIHPPGAKFSP